MISARKPKSQRGFSIVESMVSLSVMAIGLMPLAQFQGTMMRGSSLAKQRSEAISQAQFAVESLRRFESVQDSAGFDYNDITNGSASVAGVNATYSQSWTVTENVDPDYKTINMVVSWADNQEETHSVTLTSNISRVEPAKSGRLYVSGTLLAPPSISVPNSDRHENIPEGATDQGDGTSIHFDEGTGMTSIYVNATGEVVFSHQNIVSIKGIIGIEDSAVGNVGVDVTDVVVSGAGPSGCYEPGTGYYACYFPSGWSGRIDVAGINTAQNWVCTNTYQDYSNVVTNLNGEDYSVIQKNKACPVHTPTLHQFS